MTMADTAETIKKTADSAAKAQNQAQAHAAEFQAAGAKAMREGIDKSVASLTELNAHGKMQWYLHPCIAYASISANAGCFSSCGHHIHYHYHDG